MVMQWSIPLELISPPQSFQSFNDTVQNKYRLLLGSKIKTIDERGLSCPSNIDALLISIFRQADNPPFALPSVLQRIIQKEHFQVKEGTCLCDGPYEGKSFRDISLARSLVV